MFRRFMLLCVLFLFPILHLMSGAWVQKKGHGYSQISFTYLSYDKMLIGYHPETWFVVSGLKRRIDDFTLQGYLEYGISDRLTVVGILPYKFLASHNDIVYSTNDPYPNDTLVAGNLNAAGTIEAGINYKIKENKYILSTAFMMGVPSARYNHPTGLRSGYDAFVLQSVVSVGRGFKMAYMSSSFGYRYKSNHYADDLIMHNELGYGIQRKNDRKTFFVLMFGAQLPLTTGQYDDAHSVQTALYQDEAGFVDVGIKINHNITRHLSINISTIGALWAKYEGDALTYNTGLSFEW